MLSAHQFISIDQNSHSLWDTVPKLEALAANSWQGIHFVEDIDVAFTRRGAAVGDTHLELARERAYRGGVSDWGATLFYTDFLGRQPFDVRDLEPYTGWSTAALSRRLDLSVDELYDRYSPSDNWQLIGSSYRDDERHHRVIGDLTVAEFAPHLTALLEHAQRDMLQVFPEAAAQARTEAWFAEELGAVQTLLAECEQGRVVDFYAQWLRCKLPQAVRTGKASGMLGGDGAGELLCAFAENYETVGCCYNDAVVGTGVGLNELNVRRGELPFFVVLHRKGHMVRTTAVLEGRQLVAGDLAWSLDSGPDALLSAMRGDGVVCVAAKAVVLIMQARIAAGEAALVLPYHGSLYMPAAHAFEARLRDVGLLDRPLRPVHRVRLRFPSCWRGCDTIIRVPAYLHRVFSADELPASRLSEELPDVMVRAERELESLKTKEGRSAVLARLAPEMAHERDELEERRRQLARDPETRSQAGEIWDRVKALDQALLLKLVEHAVQLLRVTELDFYDTRGAVLPWAVALGGHKLYQRVLDGADIYPEPYDASGT